MKIPKDPTERFQYYFDITTGLDDKYNKKINKIKAESFEYDPKSQSEYRQAEKANAENARYLRSKYKGDYAEYSEGYDNSLQQIADMKITEQEKQANREAAASLESAAYSQWLEEQNKRIERAKKKYAKEFGNAIYNMQKANEEITMKKRMV